MFYDWARLRSYGKLWGSGRSYLVDALDWAESVLLVSLGSDVVVLPSFSCVGTLVPVSAVSVARSVMIVPGNWQGPSGAPRGHCRRFSPLLEGGGAGYAPDYPSLICSCFSCSG